jgi:release factor glutamine methyltransferase
MPNNTLTALMDYFREELKEKFSNSEISKMTEILFNHYFGLSKVELILEGDRQFSESELLKVIRAVKELKKDKPLAYILGEWEFYGLSFKVNKSTLIPRPETEELVDLMLKENTKGSILDVGTGTGCIAISLKKNNSSFHVAAYDVSEDALEVGRKNANLNDVDVEFVQCDILKYKGQRVDSKFDIIVSNPPYIPEQEKELMESNVLDYEPGLALFVKDDSPLAFYEAISDFAKVNLKKGGKLYFEINERYGSEVKDMLISKAYTEVEVVKDINDRDRIVKAQLVD